MNVCPPGAWETPQHLRALQLLASLTGALAVWELDNGRPERSSGICRGGAGYAQCRAPGADPPGFRAFGGDGADSSAVAGVDIGTHGDFRRAAGVLAAAFSGVAPAAALRANCVRRTRPNRTATGAASRCRATPGYFRLADSTRCTIAAKVPRRIVLLGHAACTGNLACLSAGDLAAVSACPIPALFQRGGSTVPVAPETIRAAGIVFFVPLGRLSA